MSLYPGVLEHLHHASHNHLLDDVPPLATGRLDAVVVPTFRAVEALRDSLALARDLGRPLIALCSGEAQAHRTVALAADYDAGVLAIDVAGAQPKLPAFRSDEVLLNAGLEMVGDLGIKRNLGLLIARASGWERVLFLDDDIYGVRHDQLDGAAAILDHGVHRVVGLRNTGYPDNSVVCHAYRAVGAEQDAFIGGGAMIADPLRTRSFFPTIYNEDWFFLLGDGVPFRAARCGTMVQRSFDPFAVPGRAAVEEFGDTVAEGLYWMLDGGEDPATCDRAFWDDFVARRRALLGHVLASVDTKVAEAGRADAIKASVRAAQGMSSAITPQLCHEFVQAWGSDLQAWGAFLDQFPPAGALEIEEVLAELGLSEVWSSSGDW